MHGTIAPSNPNRHIVDQLADIRAEIKALEKREGELKQQVSALMGPAADSLGGDEFIAHQRLTTRAGGLDGEAMKAAGIDIGRYRKPDTTVLTITTTRRVAEEVA